MKTITNAMRSAIQTYYFHRLRAVAGTHKWDKQADLEAIDHLAQKMGFHFDAAAGTMWFTYDTKTTHVVLVTNGNDFPEFKMERTKLKKEDRHVPPTHHP